MTNNIIGIPLELTLHQEEHEHFQIPLLKLQKQH